MPVLIYNDEFTSLDLASPSNPNGAWRPNEDWQNLSKGYKDFAGTNWNISPNDAAPFPSFNPFTISTPSTSIIITPGVEFAATSVVHQALPDNAPLDPNSSLWVANLQSQITNYYGYANVNIDQYTPPIHIVSAGVPTQQVLGVRSWDATFDSWGKEPLEQQLAAVPIPPDFSVSPGTDAGALIYQPSTGKYWELWVAVLTGGNTVNSVGQTVPQWQAAWGGKIDNLSINTGHFPTVDVVGASGYQYGPYIFGTAATGLPQLAYMMTVKEQQAGVINHMIALGIPQTQASVHYAPAQRDDGWSTDATAIPEGVIFRFPASLDLNAITMDPYARMIAKAVQKHGMVISDTSGSVAFSGEYPGSHYPSGNPYYGPAGIGGGILSCPVWSVNPPPSCYADGGARLAGFPWGSLQALLGGSRP